MSTQYPNPASHPQSENDLTWELEWSWSFVGVPVDLEVTSGWFGQDHPSDQPFESVLCSFTEACEGELSRLSLAFV